MIWLTWRQFRPGALMMAGSLAVLVLVLGLSGPRISDAYARGLAACETGGGCSGFAQRFFDDHHTQYLLLSALVLVLPALIGLFWGAPVLARELEAGTHRLVWNQGVTRWRWLAVKLGAIGLASAAAAGVTTLTVSWWATPLDAAGARDYPKMAPLLFATRGLVPVGSAVLAFAVGVVAGILVRRTVPAMAITMVVFVAVQVAMPLLVRPHLRAPVTSTSAATIADLDSETLMPDGAARVVLRARTPDPGSWMLSSRTLDPSGKQVDTVYLPARSRVTCPNNPATRPQASAACMVATINRLGYRLEMTYQPVSRYWSFQWAETGIDVVLSAGLSAFCFWWVRRRLT